ncbi:MAG TPA: alcohol dehydrogenase catalytic domain-containing protein, partial [Candidatus Nanoarchaeia archaeon]|nr:alcohol dehydrogenase catalytic domain-containing protein [Candidatus Nanoarchaeia archaeon]
VAVSAVCGSDLKIINRPFRPGLQIPGHEFAGKVIESYDGKSLLGERVTAFPMFSCLKCESCDRRDYRDCKSKPSLGFDLQGTYAEEVIVDARFTIRLHDKINYEQGALIEHLCCGFRLAQEVEKLVQIDDRILILGDGPMALADLQFLKLLGYHDITLVGKHQERMDFAMGLGAKQVMSFEMFVRTYQKSKQLFDAFIFTVSDNATIDHLSHCFKNKVIVFPQARISDEYMARLVAEKDAKFGRAFAYHIDDFAKVMDLIVLGEIKSNELISARINLTEVEKLTPLLFAKNKIKTLIVNPNFF